MTEFPCPHCQISLRIRDESFRNRVISCPDCGQDVLIREGSAGLTGVIPESSSAPKKLATRLGPRPAWGLPQIIAGAVALLFLVGIVFLSLERPAAETVTLNEQTEPSPAVPEPTPEPVPEPPQETETASSEMPEPLEPKADSAESPDVERLKTIGTMIHETTKQTQQFPHSIQNKNSSGWSWLAELAERHLPGNAVRHADAGWDAAVNDEFVRRPFPQFLNPSVAEKAGEDHYPTTHYVGIAGLVSGENGIFGLNQIVKPEEVTDGLSHTMMIAGVTTQLGSWARPGMATTRKFSQEPYINGPDGFGTGQADGMFVLMADGSVRFLNQNTEPDVIRQLASMNDSGQQKPVTTPMVPPAPPEPDAPIGVVMTPELPKIDLSARLNQPIVAFELKQPVPLEDLMMDIQELLGLPIDLSSLSEPARQQRVSLSIKSVTVGDLLREIAQVANVGYTVHPTHVVVQPR
ncbi:MAG TPA: DUF1559 domain-containing protein [Planctomicrobium sp.]|nr:DUF1559 domain-containing protein [Planctomicrobium sp.]